MDSVEAKICIETEAGEQLGGIQKKVLGCIPGVIIGGVAFDCQIKRVEDGRVVMAAPIHMVDIRVDDSGKKKDTYRHRLEGWPSVGDKMKVEAGPFMGQMATVTHSHFENAAGHLLTIDVNPV
jgi:hypothetical protein